MSIPFSETALRINTGEVEIAGLSDEKQNQFLKVHKLSARVSYTCTYTYFLVLFDRSAKIVRRKQTASKPRIKSDFVATVLFSFFHLFEI